MKAEALRQLNPPDRPGVYLLRDIKNKIIYIGKAISLRKRLSSYFRSLEKLDPKTQALAAKIENIEFMVTDSEVDALILENTLIKKHRPRYNIMMRDDKSYPYIKLTVTETFPRLITTRKPFVDEAKYFGPFAATGSLPEVVRAISRYFRLCQVKQPVQPDKQRKRRCLYYQMGQCDGVCLGEIRPEAYAGNVRAVIRFLEGGADPISPQLQVQMRKAAQERQFELAAALRDQREIIKKIRQQPTVSSTKREDHDVFGLARSGSAATVEIFYVRVGNLEGRRHFYLQGIGTQTDSEILSQVLTQYYSQPVTIPSDIIIPTLPAEESLIAQWLQSRSEGGARIRLPRKGEEKRLLAMAQNNAWLYLKHNVQGAATELSEEDRKALEDLAAHLHLSGPPLRVEGYDISNLAGQDAVGSQVVFWNGRPDKAKYRRYRIRSVEGPNDFAMLQEVLFRRFKKMKTLEESPPDLIVVDGGAGQLSAARKVLQELDLLHLPVIGLAKKEEEIYQPDQQKPLVLPKSSRALCWLIRLRDEAHRFALSYHRKIRSRRMRISDLD
ncbi:excinuclease ABC subunit UvrC, partial [bacterium]|nr:excinuclease ABC subunit UvrC [bacterium]